MAAKKKIKRGRGTRKAAPSEAYKNKAKLRSAQKRAAKRGRRKLWVSPEWQRAAEDVVAAFASQEIRALVIPFVGAAGKRTTNSVVKYAARVATQVRAAVYDDLPEAMSGFAARHPPCRPTIRCMHVALIDVAAQNAFEDGRYDNPMVAFNALRVVLDRYLRGRS